MFHNRLSTSALTHNRRICSYAPLEIDSDMASPVIVLHNLRYGIYRWRLEAAASGARALISHACQVPCPTILAYGTPG